MKTFLEEIAKFHSKMETCLEKVKSNIRDYGAETFQRIENAPRLTGHRKRVRDEEEDVDGPALLDGEATDDGDDLLLAQNLEQLSLTKSNEALKVFPFEDCKNVCKDLNVELMEVKKTIDLNAVVDWRRRSEFAKQKKTEFEEYHASYSIAVDRLDSLKQQRKLGFLESFQVIRRELKKTYQLLAANGDADLELIDSNDPFLGIRYNVRPPKKTWKEVPCLSGGEKTLSSLALVFALHRVKPTPVYILDEIDAALDFRNVDIVASYILSQAAQFTAQFIIISLRSHMFERAHQLLGVYKVNDMTRSLVISPMNLAMSISARLQHQFANQNQNNKRERGGHVVDEEVVSQKRRLQQLEA